MKYTIGWELYEEKSPILWEKYDYQFPRFTPYDGFYCIFLNYEKLMGKPLRIPYAELYHKMEIKWEKCTHIMGKVWASISQNFHAMDFVAFSHTVGNLWGNPCISHMMSLVNFFLYHTSSFMHFALIFSEYITITSSEEALKVWEYNFLLEM